MPTLMVSAFLMLAALLSFMCGLILDTIAKTSRKKFELLLNIVSRQVQHEMEENPEWKESLVCLK